MSGASVLLPEFDQEMAATKRLLERVPDARLDWKPHPKSMPLGRLASHLAELAGWGVQVLQHDELDLAPPGGPPPAPYRLASRREIVAAFDANVAAARAALAGASDAVFGQPWALKRGGQTLMLSTKGAILRGLVLSHLIHHRGQLTVFLRLCDVSLPPTYGPSADEARL